MVAGRIFSFWFLVFTFAAVFYYMERAKKGNLPSVRPIAGLEALDEAIGRATELGRPVFFVPGRAEINSSDAAQTLAALEILSHVAEKTAAYDTGLITAISAPNVYPVAQEVIHESYLKAGKSDAYNDDMVQFYSSEQFAFGSACLGTMMREKVAAAIMVGFFQAESLLLAEGANQAGAVSISGCTRLYQIPFFVVACDYTLIGEELFAGGAYLTKNPVKLGSMAGQDLAKLVSVIFLALGAIMETMGNHSLTKLFKK